MKPDVEKFIMGLANQIKDQLEKPDVIGMPPGKGMRYEKFKANEPIVLPEYFKRAFRYGEKVIATEPPLSSHVEYMKINVGDKSFALTVMWDNETFSSILGVLFIVC